MLQWIFYGMVFLGSALMIYNIISFIRFARSVKKNKAWNQNNTILYIPIILLIMFFAGYIAIGIFGKPDLVVGGVLFGGSIFVLIMYILLHNITDRISKQERVEAELMAAEQSSQMKSAFLATISHEMRTPMNVILGLTRKLVANERLPYDTKEDIRKVHESSEMLHVMINNMLDLSDIEAGEFTVHNEEFELTDMLRRVTDIAQILCGNKGLKLRTVVGDGTCFRYYGDEMLIAQAILALLDNAVKYTDVPGQVTFTTSCMDADEDSRTLIFEIADTGVGIDEEYLPNIFELFSTEDGTSTTRYRGSGTGLPATKSRLSLLGGTIDVESTKDVGTTFTITIPLTLAGRQSAEDQPKKKTEADITLEGKRILIVEDIEENAEIVADLLEIEGAISEHAENGQVAFELFSRAPAYHYDAILMDLRMPIVDGLEAAKKIRALDREEAKTIPILALTANAFESDKEKTREAGMNAHLTKPVDPDLMYAELKHFIFEARQQRKDR